MTVHLVECVPNISEGRRRDVIDAVADAVRETPGTKLLNVQSDESHNRSVLTFAGEGEAVGEAAVAMAKKAAELIDLREHTGQHPRVGAVDVVPFVPIGMTSMDDCVALARSVGERIWSEARIPVYLYGEAATAQHRKRLPDIRRGEFEGLAEKMKSEGWAPDFGGPEPHPTAGAAVVGARRLLVAYNINLRTGDVHIARAVARAIRESGGGLVNVQALGVISESGLAQVTVNIHDASRTSMARVFELVRIEAARYGISIAESEVVGLVPMDALIEVARFALRLRDFDRSQVLEARLVE